MNIYTYIYIYIYIYTNIYHFCMPLYDNIKLEFVQKDIFLNLKSVIFWFVQKLS